MTKEKGKDCSGTKPRATGDSKLVASREDKGATQKNKTNNNPKR